MAIILKGDDDGIVLSFCSTGPPSIRSVTATVADHVFLFCQRSGVASPTSFAVGSPSSQIHLPPIFENDDRLGAGGHPGLMLELARHIDLAVLLHIVALATVLEDLRRPGLNHVGASAA
jgi:hypothetical protein